MQWAPKYIYHDAVGPKIHGKLLEHILQRILLHETRFLKEFQNIFNFILKQQ